MSVVFYARDMFGAGEWLKKVAEVVGPKERIEVHQSIQSLIQRLREPRENYNIVVLLAVRKEDLMEMISIKHLLSDIRLVLIVPDSEEETIAQGHQLYPRFMGFRDSDFERMGDVLKKMLDGRKADH